MDQTAPPAGASPYARPEPWPIDEWRQPAIGAALALLTLPAVASVLVGLLVLAVQGRASWLLVTASALVTAVVGALASAIAFQRRDRRPVRLLAAIAAAWGVVTLVAGVVVGLELESTERVALAVMLVVGGAWTALFGLLLWVAWYLLPPGESDRRTSTRDGDDDGTGADAPASGTATGATAAAGARADDDRSATGRPPGVTSPGPASTGHAGTGTHPGTHAVTGTPGTDDPALADWPEWGGARPAADPGPVPADVTATAAATAPATPADPAPAPGSGRRAEPVRTEPVRTEPVRTEQVQPEPVRTAPAEPEPLAAAATPAEPTPAASARAEAVRPAATGRTASSATPPASSVDDTMVVDGPLLDDDDLDVPEPPAPTPPRRSVASTSVRARRASSGGQPTQRLSGTGADARGPEGGPPTQRLPHVDR